MTKLTNLTAAIALGVAGIGGSALGLNELARETALPRSAAIFTFDTSQDGQARRAVDQAMKTRNYAPATQLVKSALSIAAYNTNARLRLAYIDFREHGNLTDQGEHYIAQSYDLAPYDPFAASWRVSFALEHWSDLTPATRNAVHNEAIAFLKSGSQVANMRNTLSGIRNDDGRLVAAIWLIEAS